MSFFNLKLFQKSDELYVLTIPLFNRILILLFALAVSATFLVDSTFSTLPIIIIVILLFSACYKESWTFDKENKEVIYGFGLLFLYKKIKVSFDLIEKFHIQGFIKGSFHLKPSEVEDEKKKLFQSEYYKFSLINKELGELTINTVKGRDKDTIYEYAKELTKFCETKLVEE